MARIEWIELRLLNWARWKVSRGAGDIGFSRAGLEAGGDRYRQAIIPISDVEASDTDAAIDRLSPPGLRLTVFEVYVGPGGIRDKAKRLCCSEPTVHARIDQAHRQLAIDLAEKQRQAAAERARVEHLQQSTKPVG